MYHIDISYFKYYTSLSLLLLISYYPPPILFSLSLSFISSLRFLLIPLLISPPLQPNPTPALLTPCLPSPPLLLPLSQGARLHHQAHLFAKRQTGYLAHPFFAPRQRLHPLWCQRRAARQISCWRLRTTAHQFYFSRNVHRENSWYPPPAYLGGKSAILDFLKSLNLDL